MGIIQPPLFAFDKRCKGCGKVQSFSDFHHSVQGAAGLSYFCKSCHRTYNRRQYTERADIREQRRFYHKLKTYGITRAQYEVMLAEQGGVCAICGELPSTGMGKAFHVDHDHATGIVRGLLCGECNTGLGKFKDDPRMVETAAAYLHKHGK